MSFQAFVNRMDNYGPQPTPAYMIEASKSSPHCGSSPGLAPKKHVI